MTPEVPQVPPFDTGNQLLSEQPSQLTTQLMDTPAGQRLVLTIRTHLGDRQRPPRRRGRQGVGGGSHAGLGGHVRLRPRRRERDAEAVTTRWRVALITLTWVIAAFVCYLLTVWPAFRHLFGLETLPLGWVTGWMAHAGYANRRKRRNGTP